MSRDFDGSTGRLGTPLSAVLRPSLPVTVAAWIWPDTITAGDGIFTTNKLTTTHRGFWLSITDASGHLEASYGDNNGTGGTNRRTKVSTSAVTTGGWRHVVTCMRGAGDMDIYLNGSDAGGAYSGTGGTMTYNSSSGGAIGMVISNTFDGKIAEVGLWGVSLSAAEVLSLAKGVCPARIRPESLLGYWPVYGLADPEIDMSGNVNNANLAGTGPVANHAPVGSPFPVAA